MSISITVRNGTAIGKESLCRTCRYAHIQLGYSESEEEVRCGYFGEQPRLVLFAVSRCSDYLSKLPDSLRDGEDCFRHRCKGCEGNCACRFRRCNCHGRHL